MLAGMGNRDDIIDAASQAVLEILDRGSAYNDPLHVDNALRQIATHRLCDIQRRKRRERHRSVSPIDFSGEDDGFRLLEEREQLQKCANQVSKRPLKHFEMCFLKYYL